MTTREQREKLLAAQQLVRAVRDSLDNSSTNCHSCSAPRYADWQSHLLWEALDGICVKLANAALRFLP